MKMMGNACNSFWLCYNTRPRHKTYQQALILQFKDVFLKIIFNKYFDKCLKSFGEVGEWLKPVPC